MSARNHRTREPRTRRTRRTHRTHRTYRTIRTYRTLRTHEKHCRDRIDRLRLPDVVPGKVHRALPAGAHAARQPQLPRRYDGQTARRLCTEHCLHAGAARRAAAADGDRRRRLRRLPPVARRRRHRHVAGAAGPRQVHARRSSAAPTPTTTRSRPSTPARWPTPASCRSGPCRTAAWPSFSPNDPGAMVQYAEECRALGIPFIFDPGQQCARMSGDELRDGIIGATVVIVERLRVRTAAAEDRHERARHSAAADEALIVTKGENGSIGADRRRFRSTCRPSRRAASSIRRASATRFAAA